MRGIAVKLLSSGLVHEGCVMRCVPAQVGLEADWVTRGRFLDADDNAGRVMRCITTCKSGLFHSARVVRCVSVHVRPGSHLTRQRFRPCRDRPNALHWEKTRISESRKAQYKSLAFSIGVIITKDTNRRVVHTRNAFSPNLQKTQIRMKPVVGPC